MSRLGVPLLAVTLLAAIACGGDDGGDETATNPEPEARVEVTTTTTTTAPSSSTTTTTQPGLDTVSVRLEEMAVLESPTALALRAGHDAMYVAEREGFVRVVDGGEVGPAALVDIAADTTTDGERGLLGLAFSPDGERLYLSFTNAGGDNQLDEFTMGAGVADIDLGSRRTLLTVDHPFSNHNGGNVIFGPDGLLYLGLGDGGASGDPEQRAQNTSELLGKILRIDPRASGADPYAIPSDNPFAGGGGRGEIYLYGVRNPWRFSFDRATGDLWIGDVGQNEVEEVDLLPAGEGAGANLGWDRLEGDQPFEGEAPAGAVGPVYTYGHDEGVSITGGFVYRGTAVPGLAGAYVFGDFGTGFIRAIQVDGGQVTGQRDLDLGVDPGDLVSFAEDTDGELLVLTISGPVYRLLPA